MKKDKLKFYAFAMNEYNYKVVPFSVHKGIVPAQRAAHKAAGPYKDTAQSDMHEYVEEDLEAFALESGYVIDWSTQRLLHHGILPLSARVSVVKSGSKFYLHGAGKFLHVYSARGERKAQSDANMVLKALRGAGVKCRCEGFEEEPEDEE